MALSWTPRGAVRPVFTMFFEHFVFRTYIVLRRVLSPHGAQHGPKWGPREAQKRPKKLFQIDLGSPFFGFDVGRPWKTDLGAIWGPSWGPLGPILGASGAILGPLGGVNMGSLGRLMAVWR